VRSQRNLEIPLPDGAVLAGDLLLPEGDGPFPTVVTYIPYHKDDLLGGTYEAYSQRYFVEHGYATLMVDFRGLGSSSGVPLEAMHRQESQDAADMVEWTAAQGWCDGNVGMWGLSYGGITSFKAGAARPPHLKAIVPMMGSLDIYHDWVYPGGCRNMLGATATWGSFMVAMQLLPPMLQDPQGRWHEVWRARLEGGAPYLLPWPEHPDRDDYWQERAVDPADIDVPMFAIGGWRDLFPQAMVDAYMQASGPRKLLMGPWLHTHPEESPFDGIDHLALMVRWWDRWLKGIENGIDEEPEVQFYSQADERWLQSPTWPPPGGADVTLALAADGSLRAGETADPGEITHTTDPSTGTAGGLWDPLGLGIGLPLDQGPDEARSLTFTSAALDGPMRVTGSPEATLQLSLEDGEHLQLVVKLSDVAPDGASSLITTGWLNARHRRSDAEAGRIEPGVTEEYAVALCPTAYAIAAGHRLRLSVSGADFPRIWPTPTTPTVKLVTGGGRMSRLVLPTSSDEAAGAYRPPPPRHDVSDAERYPRVVAFDPKWEVSRDMVTGETTVMTGGHFVLDTPSEGGRIDFDHTGRAIVRPDRPDAAHTRAQTVARATTPLGAQVEILVSTLATNHGTSVTGKVTVDGVTVFERAWQGTGHASLGRALAPAGA
jgi:putative CocE/NonD family hydrolase